MDSSKLNTQEMGEKDRPRSELDRGQQRPRMSNPRVRSRRPLSMQYSPSAIDGCTIVVLLACIYSAIVGPLLAYSSAATNVRSAEPAIPNRIFWPILAAVSIIIIARNYSRFSRITFPPHIIFFFAYVGFAGASVAWAFKPEIALTRYTQQLMVLTSIVFPALLAQR